MIKKTLNIAILSSLLISSSCSEVDMISTAAVGGLLVYMATLDQGDRLNHDGETYYKTISCNRNIYYYDATGYEYYARDCIIRNDKAYVTFGLSSLLVAVLIYKK